MDAYAGRVLAERYRLPLRPAGDDEFTETRALDTYSGQEILLRQVPLPEVVEAEFVDEAAQDGGRGGGPWGGPYGGAAPALRGGRARGTGVADRSPRDPAVRRALEAATAAARLPDHPRLDQVFDVFVQDGSLWIAGELIPARPLSALLAGRTLSPHRAAEIAADVLTALRTLHAHGWLHRNITARTVLICDDGRAILSGLAVGAAQEALCGYDPVPGEANGTGEATAIREPGAGTGAILVKAPPRDVELAKYAPADDSSPGSGSAAYGRPLGGLAAERARQTRLAVIGPVTERWAPEQAGPVHEAGPSAPQAGPATDLWAVGALLLRAVRGRAPYPEESAAELARLVCSWPPVTAEDCGDLRPVVESLLCRDPAGRPDIEELRGRLRSLIRTAPEAEIGTRAVTMPALDGAAADPRRLPAVRRRGELVREGRREKGRDRRTPGSRPPSATPVPASGPASGPAATAPVPRPRRLPEQSDAPRRPRTERQPRATGPAKAMVPVKPAKQPKPVGQAKPVKPVKGPKKASKSARQRAAQHYEQQMMGQVGLERVGAAAGPPDAARPSRAPRARGPRHLGRLLLAVILLLVVAAIAYAFVFMPKSGADTGGGPAGADRTGAATAGRGDGRDGGAGAGAGATQTTAPAGLAKGFEVRKDPQGFQVAVRKGWERRGANDRGQVRYVGGDYELVIVPGRDTTAHFGTDPMAYQQDREAELQPYRDSGWSSSSRLRRTDVGKTAMAEGTFTWRDSSGREVYVRNLAMIHDGRYHLVLVIGPNTGRREADLLYQQATDAYRPG
ncbi:protein kinase [Streptomyces celluloflavus]|uniref:protein kinase n=1 Tax=Streptomyces celluloflavus TaxID=58344 RepID=UPI00364D379A